MNSRRQFLKSSVAITGMLSLPLAEIGDEKNTTFAKTRHLAPEALAQDETFWEEVAQTFTVDRDVIDLNNAGISPQPRMVQQALIESYEKSNKGPSHYLWNVANKNRDHVKQRLAGLAGVDASEIVLTRNATEALGIVSSGLPLEKNSEVVMTRFDYPNMIHAWKQRELREGIKINWVDLTLPVNSESAIVEAFIKATTPQTKVWHITQMINWTGQILPVKELCEEASKRNIISIVDGAQSFAHLHFNLSDIKPDFFATTLHKWLCAPYGLGMLCIKPEHISKLWPLFPNEKPQSDEISKFESAGTRFFPAEMAVPAAIDFHEKIGGKQKEERLRYLKNYWCEKLSKNPRVKFYTSSDAHASCGIASFSVEGISTDELRSRLFSEFKIITVNAKIENIDFVRVSPGMYTLKKDLDKFVEAVVKICGL